MALIENARVRHIFAYAAWCYRVMKHLLYCLSLVLCGAVSSAVADDAASFDDMFMASDIASISTHLTDLHAAHLAGAVEASDLRTPFSRFSGTAPHIEPMIDAWLAADPQSPYANAAAAWVYYGIAWRLRGNDIYRYTWPAAMEGFNANLAKSQSHAWAAFDVAPDLVAASDALLVNEMALDQLGPFGVLQLTQAVMAATPNRGTLQRASAAFRPDWGGDMTRVEQLCRDNAGRVESVENYTVDACIADMILWNGVRGDLAQRSVQVLADHGWDGFEEHRYSSYVRGRDTGLTVEDVADYLMQDDVVDYALAQEFYNEQFYNFPRSEVNRQIAATQIILRTKDAARDRLPHDPGDPTTVEMVLFGTETAVDRVAHPNPDEAAALWGNVIAAAPYDPSWWMETGYNLNRTTDAGYRAGGMAAFGNAIAYSNHKPDYIGAVLNHVSYEHVDLARRDADFDTAAYDAAVTCPAVRLQRLFAAVCDGSPRAFRCNMRARIDDLAVPILADAQARGVCETERQSTLPEIVFYPSDITLGDYAHSADR